MGCETHWWIFLASIYFYFWPFSPLIPLPVLQQIFVVDPVSFLKLWCIGRFALSGVILAPLVYLFMTYSVGVVDIFKHFKNTIKNVNSAILGYYKDKLFT